MGKAWMMAGAAVLAVAGCGENAGWNPNYRHSDSPYGRYLVDREAALTGQAAVPRVIPVTLPQQAPRPEEIGANRVVVVTARPAETAPAPLRSRPETRPASGYGRTHAILARYATTLGHDPGEARFARSAGGNANAAAACARYPTPEAAQIAFIARGGPNVDPLGLDPDGDGFVCGWDPRPLREAGL